MVARELRIAKVIIPKAPGHFSAYGMLVSELRRDFVHTCFMPLADASFAEIRETFDRMERDGRAAIGRGDVGITGISISRAADMRYVGQEHAVTVDLPAALFDAEDRIGIKRAFDEIHQLRYGYAAAREPAEIVSLRSAVTGLMPKPDAETVAVGSTTPPKAAARGERPVFFAQAQGFVPTPTFDRPRLEAGNRIAGPALIEEHASTTVVHPGDRLEVDAFGNLVIEIDRN